MNNVDIWKIMTGAQVSTALVIIAISLALITVKLYDNTKSKKRSR